LSIDRSAPDISKAAEDGFGNADRHCSFRKTQAVQPWRIPGLLSEVANLVRLCTSGKLPFGLEAAGPAIPPALAMLVAQASPNDLADKPASDSLSAT
jgi:hypothetical protein